MTQNTLRIDNCTQKFYVMAKRNLFHHGTVPRMISSITADTLHETSKAVLFLEGKDKMIKNQL
jgi:hypothetical protein